MAKMICTKCNLEFPSDFVYLDHKKGNHKTQLEKGVPIESPPIPTPPPGIPQDAMPSPEFMAQIERMEAEKAVKDNPRRSEHPSEVPPTKPIKLTYNYTGECPDCRAPVSTLEIDVAEKHFCIAFCKNDNKQIESRDVVKL